MSYSIISSIITLVICFLYLYYEKCQRSKYDYFGFGKLLGFIFFIIAAISYVHSFVVCVDIFFETKNIMILGLLVMHLWKPARLSYYLLNEYLHKNVFQYSMSKPKLIKKLKNGEPLTLRYFPWRYRKKYGTPLNYRLANIFSWESLIYEMVKSGAAIDNKTIPIIIDVYKNNYSKCRDLFEIITKGKNLSVILNDNYHGLKNSPLVLAIENEEENDFYKYLIRQGADLDIINNNGDTPLHIAVQLKKYNLAYWLLKVGANGRIKNKSGDTPVDIAPKGKKNILLNIIKQQSIFAKLDFELDKSPFGERNKYKAKIFENIYNNNCQEPGFKDDLLTYVKDDEDKYFWLVLFLYDGSYTDINNFDLAEEILSVGIADATGALKVIYIWDIALLVWMKGDLERAGDLFHKAIELGGKYPGRKRAWSEEVTSAIFDYYDLWSAMGLEKVI
jgi:hypothetical protein